MTIKSSRIRPDLFSEFAKKGPATATREAGSEQDRGPDHEALGLLRTIADAGGSLPVKELIDSAGLSVLDVLRLLEHLKSDALVSIDETEGSEEVVALTDLGWRVVKYT